MTELEDFHETQHAPTMPPGIEYWECPAWPCRALREEAAQCECDCPCGCRCGLHRAKHEDV